MDRPARKPSNADTARDAGPAASGSSRPAIDDASLSLVGDILNTMDQGLVAFDRELSVIIANRRASDLLGLPAEMLRPGADFAAVIGHAARRGDYGPGDPARRAEAILGMARGSAAHRIERTLPDGRTIEIRSVPRPGGGFVTTYTDVTESQEARRALVRARQDLEEKRRQIDIALDNMTQGLALYDGAQRLILCNRRYREIFGYTEDEARPGITLRELLEISIAAGNHGAEDGPALIEERFRIARSRKRQAQSQRFADGRVIEVLHQPLADGGAVATFTDITERVRSAAEMQAARQHAEIASRTKSEFLANMSHELRTPLNAIIGFSEILRHEIMGPLGHPQYLEYATDIHDSGTHLLSLINDILDLSKIEAGKLDLMEESVDVSRLVAGALRIVRARAEAARLTLYAELPENPPRLLADARALKQVLLNLLSNAVKFTPAQGNIVVRAEIDGEGLYVLAVSDSGVGIAGADIPKVMAVFGQADSTLARSHEGTGLGLPLARSLVELHGGTFAIESEVGVGTTVTIRLPAGRVVRPRAA